MKFQRRQFYIPLLLSGAGALTSGCSEQTVVSRPLQTPIARPASETRQIAKKLADESYKWKFQTGKKQKLLWVYLQSASAGALPGLQGGIFDQSLFHTIYGKERHLTEAQMADCFEQKISSFEKQHPSYYQILQLKIAGLKDVQDFTSKLEDDDDPFNHKDDSPAKAKFIRDACNDLWSQPDTNTFSISIIRACSFNLIFDNLNGGDQVKVLKKIIDLTHERANALGKDFRNTNEGALLFECQKSALISFNSSYKFPASYQKFAEKKQFAFLRKLENDPLLGNVFDLSPSMNKRVHFFLQRSIDDFNISAQPHPFIKVVCKNDKDKIINAQVDRKNQITVFKKAFKNFPFNFISTEAHELIHVLQHNGPQISCLWSLRDNIFP